MSTRKGRCTNIELCQVATSQRVVELQADEPFICPRCSSDLADVSPKRERGGVSKMLVLQIGVILLGAAGIGYKVLGGSAAAPAMIAAHVPPPSPAKHDMPTAAEAPIVPVVASAGPVPAPAPVMPQARPTTVLLRLAGSDVIAGRLARRLAAGYLAMIGDTDIEAVPGAQPGRTDIVGKQAGELEAISIVSSSTAGGFNALLRGQADVAMALRQASPGETESLAGLGDVTSPDVEHVAAVNAVAVIVNPSVHVPSLSRKQLAAILTGQARDWSELGAETSRPVHAYLPDSQPGQGDTPASLLLPDPSAASAARREQDDSAVASAVARDPGGIGFVDAHDAGAARTLAVSDGGQSVGLTEQAIATEDYPLTRRVYLYGAASGNNFVRRFTDYIASPTGQAAVEAAGFVSLAVKAQPPAAPPDASQRFRAFVGGAERLSTTFRFESGSVVLDSRGLRDVDRLAAFFRARHVPADHLLLAGFADNAGQPAANEAVAQRRVSTVAAALAHAGITPGQVASFGAEMPLADNGTAEGRERNRRVEAYLVR